MSSIRTRLIAAGLWDVNDPRDPETDIAAAWEIAKRRIYLDCDLEIHIRHTGRLHYHAYLTDDEDKLSISVSGYTFAEMLCRLALRDQS